MESCLALMCTRSVGWQSRLNERVSPNSAELPASSIVRVYFCSRATGDSSQQQSECTATQRSACNAGLWRRGLCCRLTLSELMLIDTCGCMLPNAATFLRPATRTTDDKADRHAAVNSGGDCERSPKRARCGPLARPICVSTVVLVAFFFLTCDRELSDHAILEYAHGDGGQSGRRTESGGGGRCGGAVQCSGEGAGGGLSTANVRVSTSESATARRNAGAVGQTPAGCTALRHPLCPL